MKKILNFSFFIFHFSLVIAAFASCGGNAKKATGAAIDSLAPLQAYVMPKIPTMITEPEEQAGYVGEHFWDNFDFRDTLNVARWSDYAEQVFVDYTYGFLANVPQEIGNKSIGTLFQKAAPNKIVFQKFAEIAEKYLFDPNSPYRNDEYYIATLETVLANPALDEWERIRPTEQLRMSLKNRVGTPAADFRYTLASGATGTLYGLKATYTLVFLNNPGCPACRETMGQILASPTLTALVDDGTMKILAVYTDENVTEWRDYAPNIPENWINSYDKELTIKTGELYDLKAIPTLYLLDSKKTVMLKDVMSIPLIEQTLNNDINNTY
jgi:thiol-disulfide isomerase/thioredoxin